MAYLDKFNKKENKENVAVGSFDDFLNSCVDTIRKKCNDYSIDKIDLESIFKTHDSFITKESGDMDYEVHYNKDWKDFIRKTDLSYIIFFYNNNLKILKIESL